MGQKMKTAPVYFTLVQVRFNPILALDSYVAKIQDQFRRHGFPDSQTALVATFNLNINASNETSAPPQVPVSQVSRYTFSNMDKTSGFILDQGSLSFQTTDYETFEIFSEEFLKGLGIVHQAVSLDYTDRIGVRYLDAVYPRPGEDLATYLNKSVLGLYGELEGELVHAFSETQMRNGTFNVITRTIVRSGEIGFPPDLQAAGFTMAKRFQSLKGVHAILDTDGVHSHRDAFNLEQIQARLSDVHSVVTNAFKMSVTARAIEIWS